jgi:signal transduction histidine kinase
MSDNNHEDALQQAKAMLDELTEAARKGAIIPIRLTGQLEAIGALLAKAVEQQAEAAGKAAVPANMESFLQEQGAFLSHAVHELRTPMTSIRGYSDMLGNAAMGTLNDMQKQFLDTIRTNTRRMEGLLTDVSLVNKLRAGTLRANVKMDMFKNVAMMVEKQITPIAEQLGRKVTFEIPQGLPLLNTDSDLLATALVKMLENSLRYTTQEAAEVFLQASADGNSVRVVIEDSGIGMTPEEIAQLGTIYYRGDNDVVRNYKGSGLGIPIAYGAFELLGDKVQVESQPEQGTKFIITLPGMT